MLLISQQHMFLPSSDFISNSTGEVRCSKSQNWVGIYLEVRQYIKVSRKKKGKQREYNKYLILPEQVHIKVQVTFMGSHLRVQRAQPQEHFNPTGAQHMLVLVKQRLEKVE